MIYIVKLFNNCYHFLHINSVPDFNNNNNLKTDNDTTLGLFFNYRA